MKPRPSDELAHVEVPPGLAPLAAAAAAMLTLSAAPQAREWLLEILRGLSL